jgi:hypothetical protein
VVSSDKGEIFVFGMLKHSDTVYTQIILNYYFTEFMPIIEQRASQII